MYYINRGKRALVYTETKCKCMYGTYGTLTKSESMVFLPNDDRTGGFLEKKFKTKIKVLNEDVLIVAQNLHDIGEENITVLNLASFYSPGGGVITGAMAQEEELFRRSNYFMSLDSTFYPMTKGSVIYTPNVTIVKDENYNDLVVPFQVNFIAAAAIKNPELIEDKYNIKDYEMMNNLIENIFKTSHYFKNETLILGAIGCGAYNNPPLEVVEIFNKYLDKYKGCFKNIFFAVKSTRDDNFLIFDRYINRA